MRHEIRIAGHAYRLRPIELHDAGLVVDLRSDPQRARYLHRISLEVAAQERYLNAYFERDGDYYFVVERQVAQGNSAEGLIGIYDMDPVARRGEFGRWIVRPGSMASVESAWLIYRVAFEQLGLDEIYCHTIVNNTAVVSFHDRAGLTRARQLEGYFEIDGKRWDAIEHSLKREQWPATSDRLEATAKRLAHRLGAAA